LATPGKILEKSPSEHLEKILPTPMLQAKLFHTQKSLDVNQLQMGLRKKLPKTPHVPSAAFCAVSCGIYSLRMQRWLVSQCSILNFNCSGVCTLYCERPCKQTQQILICAWVSLPGLRSRR